MDEGAFEELSERREKLVSQASVDLFFLSG